MISVIVPVFSVEPFLDECILSLLRQTYEDLEIILVDDGSPDCCGKICDHYAAIDKRIRVIHKNNGGLSDARNAGIDIARGEYIGFIDSDDYVSSDMFAFLLSLMEDTLSDISICGHVKTTYRGKHRPLWHHRKVYVMDSEEALAKMLQFGYYESFAWNKLFIRELFESIRFPSGKLRSRSNRRQWSPARWCNRAAALRSKNISVASVPSGSNSAKPPARRKSA